MLLEKARWRAAKGATDDEVDRARACRARRPRPTMQRARSTPRSGAGAVRRRCRRRRSARRGHAGEAAAAGGRPRQGPLRRLVRALPALVGRPQGASRRVVPQIADLGFDVLYLPPIHPIGVKNRKGRNNTLVAGPDDPGSPYAIGAAEGGHDAVHPELGTLEDVRDLCADRHQHGMDVALDFALNALRRPPVARPSTRSGSTAPGRHAQVRREPAQALPGHLQLQLGQRGLARRCGRRWLRRLPALGRRAA